jgi:hypothetical protein
MEVFDFPTLPAPTKSFIAYYMDTGFRSLNGLLREQALLTGQGDRGLPLHYTTTTTRAEVELWLSLHLLFCQLRL